MNLVPEVIVMSVVGCLCMSVVVSLVHLWPFSFVSEAVSKKEERSAEILKN